ncbi:MAG: indole-3-glycerol-phosphate synthase [Proteobacteria bacterium]|nr:indole-3-glycerol-phosphate synthase [Pseudomonadota bacterium]
MNEAGDFLAAMARGSEHRVAESRARLPAARLAGLVAAQPAPPALRLDARFDLIAELKLRSPALGVLAGSAGDLEQRVVAYARGGAAIVSVLTEPARFDGSLGHLERASAALAPHGVPTMRKDFLVDPYQLLEARAAGASGVLLIARMLSPARLDELVAAAAELGLFVLVEAFDAADIDAAARAGERWQGPAAAFLVGVNSRDLRTLEVVPERLAALAPRLPPGRPRVAESGLEAAGDAARLAAAGYTLALVGGALMAAPDPAALVRAMIEAGRAARVPA